MQTLPFFALIGLGYLVSARQFFHADDIRALTRFVFYFALPAMLFDFSAKLSLREVYDHDFIMAYLLASTILYTGVSLIGYMRGRGVAETAIAAQCSVIGNVGFLGIPMLALLFGERAVGFVMMVLAVDLFVFGSLVIALVVGSKDGRFHFSILKTIALGLVQNPMLVAMALGFSVSALGIGIPPPLDILVKTLGNSAIAVALFVIGASLAFTTSASMQTALSVSFCKLILHPACVAFFALLVFEVDPYGAGVMIAAAALPVAGNIYIIAAHYRVYPARVSSAILVSTIFSVFTVTILIGLVRL